MQNFYIGNVCCNLASIKTDLKNGDSTRVYYEHYHSCFEFQYVIKGNYKFWCKNRAFDICEGEVLLIPPRIYHRVTHTSDDAFKLSFCIDIDKPSEDCEESDIMFYNTFVKAELTRFKVNTSLMKLSLSQLRDGASYDKCNFLNKEKMRVMCHMFLLEIFGQLLGNEKIEADTKWERCPQQEEVIDVFFAHSFMSNSSKKSLAGELHVSLRQLQRVMKKNYNMNYRQKLNEIRMEIATNMLQSTDKTISQIAELLGYSSSANFSTFIKNHAGKTPSEIRKIARK